MRVDEEEVFSVGSLAGDDWEMFSTVAGVAFDQEGNLYILDRENFRVVKVGPQGQFLSEMGRAGGGPGEFGMPVSLAVTPGGEVRVFDMGRQGFTLFNPDGSFKTILPLAGGELFLPNGGLLNLPDGDMVDGGASRMRLQAFGAGGDELAPRPVNRFTLSDEVEITTAFEAWNPLSAAGPQREETVSGGGFQVSSAPMRAFDAGLFVGVLPSGHLAVADSTTYAIKLVAPDGNVERTLRRPFAPKEVTRRDQAAERERQLDLIAAREESSSSSRGRVLTSDGGGGSGTIAVSGAQVSDLLRARVERMEFGEEIPVIANMVVDWTGRIWVQRTGQGVGEEGPIDLIGADGGYVGTVDPEAFRIPEAFGPNGLVAYVETDELDVPRVVVKRLSVR